MRRRGLCGSGLIAEASAAVSRARVSTICWSISTCHVLGFFAGAVLDYSAGFSLPMPDAETSISEEPGARKGHAGICAGGGSGNWPSYRDDALETASHGTAVRIFGLDDYQLSPAALRRLGEQSVRFSVQLRGLKMPSLLPLRPKQRDVKLRAALKQQFKQLAQHFPEVF